MKSNSPSAARQWSIALFAWTALVPWSFACATVEPSPHLESHELGRVYDDVKATIFHSPTGFGFESLRYRGPVRFSTRDNQIVTLENGEKIRFDDFSPSSTSNPPLVILVHGNHSRKEAHRFQAQHLASYGIHAITVDLENQGRWPQNAKKIAKLTRHLTANPASLPTTFDPQKIILVGHSFGGSTVTIAASLTDVKGLVLLDPAVFNKSVQKAMVKVARPALVIAADAEIYRARKRGQFFRSLAGETIEVMVTNSTHDDAQSPSMFALSTYGLDPFTSTARQEIVTALLTSGVLSIVTTGNLDFVANLSDELLQKNILKEKRTKVAKIQDREGA